MTQIQKAKNKRHEHEKRARACNNIINYIA